MGHRRKKKRTHVKPSDDPNAPKPPKSFVIRSGAVGRSVAALSRDVRRVLEPNTAAKLRERKTNKLKDFVAVAGQLSVTHFMIFSRTDAGTNLRIARVPRGPTLTFRVTKYSLTKDVIASQRNPKSPGSEFKTSPLLVLNNFGGEEKALKLMTTMFQNLFPAINVQTMQLADARRIVLLNYNSETKRVDFRHYSIHVKPTGISKSVKRVINLNVPSLGDFQDISEYVLREAHASESDVEDAGESNVVLPQHFPGRNNRQSEQRAIRLVELGPRMELKLLKIQAGLCEGEILHHDIIQKTPEEVREMAQAREKRKAEAAERKRAQEENVKRKLEEKEKHRIATGGKKKEEEEEEEEEVEDEEEEEEKVEDEEEDEMGEEEDDNEGMIGDEDLNEDLFEGDDNEDEEVGEDGEESQASDNDNLFDEEEFIGGLEGARGNESGEEEVEEEAEESEEEVEAPKAPPRKKPKRGRR
ncbi:uncharacterized protein VTP21DRAFT_8788 [Calcarisporiella thermophila]|uniref:uncharacterized protein n=1 Tax=Calcarisporiella thermophila TaxID=911321 RepID=UPI00374475C7